VSSLTPGRCENSWQHTLDLDPGRRRAGMEDSSTGDSVADRRATPGSKGSIAIFRRLVPGEPLRDGPEGLAPS